MDTWAAALADPTGNDATRAVGGVFVLVSSGRTEVYGFGVPVIGAAGPPLETTCFQLGSVSKVLTGLILAALVETPGSGIHAADDVNQHLSGVVVPAPPWGGVVTLEALTSHSSGLVSFPTNPTGTPVSPFSDYTQQDLVSFLTGSDPVFNADASYFYSNLGVGILGIALADAEGMPSYGPLLQQHLLTPLGMTRTGLNEPSFTNTVELAQGYRVNGNQLVAVGCSSMGVLASAGEVISNGADVARFLRVMTGMDAFPVAGAVERAVSVVTNRAAANEFMGYSWDITTVAGEPTRYEKGGVTAGYTSFLAFYREPAVGVGVLVNRGQAGPGLRDAAEALLRALAGL